MKMSFFALLSALMFHAVAANNTTRSSTAKNNAAAADAAVTRTTGPTQLDDLMRGEMAAVKAYDQLLKDVKGPQAARLKAIRQDHVTALSVLSAHAANKPDVKEDTESAGPWGTFAQAWVKGGSLISNDAALNALRQGEEHGIDEYQEALEDDSISPKLKDSIRAQLLPKQREHIKALKNLM